MGFSERQTESLWHKHTDRHDEKAGMSPFSFSCGLSYCFSSLRWNQSSSFNWAFLSCRIWCPFSPLSPRCRCFISASQRETCCQGSCRCYWHTGKKPNSLVLHHPRPVTAYGVFWRKEWSRKLRCGSGGPVLSPRSVPRPLPWQRRRLELSLYGPSASSLHLLSCSVVSGPETLAACLPRLS